MERGMADGARVREPWTCLSTSTPQASFPFRRRVTAEEQPQSMLQTIATKGLRETAPCNPTQGSLLPEAVSSHLQALARPRMC